MLDHALRLGRAPLVQRLMREGAFPHRAGERTRPPAARRLDAVAASSGFASEAASYMHKALRVAASRDDHRAARGLMLHGCAPDNGLLYMLVRKRRAPRVVRALLAAGADPNYADDIGTHLLALAALQNDVALTRTLLAARADPLVEEDSGQSVLELARANATVPELIDLMERAVEEGTQARAHEPAA